jgi:hypothetical protein
MRLSIVVLLSFVLGDLSIYSIPPSEVFTKEEILAFRDKINPTLEDLRIGGELLQRYQDSNPNEKRTAEDRQYDPNPFLTRDTNKIRNRVRELNLKIAEPFLIQNSPYLYTIHKKVSSIHKELGDENSYRSSLYQSLRFRRLGSTEEVFKSIHKDPEILETESIQSSKEHFTAWEEMIESQKKLKYTKDRIHLLESEALQDPSKLSEVPSLKESIPNLEKVFKDKESFYIESKKNKFLPWKSNYDKETGELIYSFSKSIQELEDTIEFNKRKNKSTHFNAFVLPEFTRRTENAGTVQFLEFALKFIPQNPNLWEDLSIEYKIQKRILESISALEKSFSLRKESNQEITANLHLRLGILESDLKRFTKARDQYLLYLQKEKDTLARQQYLFPIADFIVQNNGNWEIAFPILEEFLKTDHPFLNAEENKKQISLANFYQSKFYHYIKKDKEEKESLVKALQSYISLSDQYSELFKESKSKEQEILKKKKYLLKSLDDDKMDEYKKDILSWEENLEKLKSIKKYKSSIPVILYIKRLVDLEEKYHQFDQCIVYLNYILEWNLDGESSYAIREIKRIRQIMANGKNG